MEQQQNVQAQVQISDELPSWEAPELVKVDVSTGTLNNLGSVFDGISVS